MTTPAKSTTIIRSGTGDKPGETEGSVIAGKSLRARWGVPDKTEVEAPTVADPPVAAAPADATPPAEPKPKVVQRPKPKSELPPRAANGKFMPSAKEVAEIAAEVVRAGAKKEEVAPVAVVAVTDNLTPQQQKRFKILQRLEQNNPTAKGIADRYATGQKKLAEYQKTWKADPANKGKEFNIDDDDHADFLKENDVSYDQDEYAEALADIKAEERMKPIEERFKSQDTERARQERVSKIMPEVIKHQRASGRVFIDKLGEEFKSLLTEANVVVPAELERLKGESEAHRTVLGMAARVEQVSAELMAIANGVVEMNGAVPLHVEIFNLVKSKDAEFKAERDAGRLPAELNGDKEFATTDEWNAMSERERQSHWHLTDADLSALYAVDMAEAAKKMLETAESDFNARAAKRGLIKQPEAKPAAAAPVFQQQRQPALQPQRPAPEPRVVPERSPVGQVAPKLAPIVEAPQSEVSQLKKRWIG